MAGESVPVKPKTGRPKLFVVLVGILVVSVFACCMLSRPSSRNVAVGPAATVAPTLAPSYKVLGNQGVEYFVAIDPKIGTGKATLKGIADAICKYQDVCIVMFWDDESMAATGVPMTDAQVSAKVAHYNLNKNTGLDRMAICSEGNCSE